MRKSKMKQYPVFILTGDDLKIVTNDNGHGIATIKSIFASRQRMKSVKMSENALLKKWGDELECFFIFQLHTDEEDKYEDAFNVTTEQVNRFCCEHGINIVNPDGSIVNFKVCAQSTSQNRSCKFWYTSKNPENIFNYLAWHQDWTVFGNVSLAKIGSRSTLSLTSGVEAIGFDPICKVIEDYTMTAGGIRQVACRSDGKFYEGRERLIKYSVGDYKFTPSDGQGLIEIKPSIDLAHKIGIFSKEDNEFFQKNFVSIRELTPIVQVMGMNLVKKLPRLAYTRGRVDKIIGLAGCNCRKIAQTVCLYDKLVKAIKDTAMYQEIKNAIHYRGVSLDTNEKIVEFVNAISACDSARFSEATGLFEADMDYFLPYKDTLEKELVKALESDEWESLYDIVNILEQQKVFYCDESVVNKYGLPVGKFNAFTEVFSNKYRIISIIQNCPSAFQIRWNKGFSKGLLGMFPFSEYDSDLEGVELLVGDNFTKAKNNGQFENEFRVANTAHVHYNPRGYNKFKMSYQMLQNLVMDSGDDVFIQIANENLAELNDIFTDADKALSFIGAIKSMKDSNDLESLTDDDSKYEDDEVMDYVSIVEKALTANPNSIHDPYILNKIKEMAKSRMAEISFGKLAVSGFYNPLLTDPFLTLAMKKDSNGEWYFDARYRDLVLPSGTCYINGITTPFAMFRCPVCCKDQQVVLQGVAKPDFWFIRNVTVLNGFDPALAYLSGGDTDGDKAGCTNDPRIIARCKKDKILPVEPEINALKQPFSFEALVGFYASSYEQNPVGIVANKVTGILETMNSISATERRYKYLVDDCFCGCFVEMAVIDQAKTGGVVDIPNQLGNKIPWWNRTYKMFKTYREAFFKIMLNKKMDFNKKIETVIEAIVKEKQRKNVTYLNTPLSRLCSYVLRYMIEVFSKFSDDGEYSLAMDLYNHAIDRNEVDRVLPSVSAIGNQHVKDIYALYKNGGVNQADFYDKYDEVMENTKKKLYNISKDGNALAIAAYMHCYTVFHANDDKVVNSKAFAWTVLTDEIIEALENCGKGRKLIPIPGYINVDNAVAFVTPDRKVFVGNTEIDYISEDKDDKYFITGQKEIIKIGNYKYAVALNPKTKLAKVKEYYAPVKITLANLSDIRSTAALLNSSNFTIKHDNGKLHLVAGENSYTIKKMKNSDNSNKFNEIFKIVDKNLQLSTAITEADLYCKGRKDKNGNPLIKKSLTVNVQISKTPTPSNTTSNANTNANNNANANTNVSSNTSTTNITATLNRSKALFNNVTDDTTRPAGLVRVTCSNIVNNAIAITCYDKNNKAYVFNCTIDIVNKVITVAGCHITNAAKQYLINITAYKYMKVIDEFNAI